MDYVDSLNIAPGKRPVHTWLAALDQTTKHFTKVSSFPLLGLEYFHQYLDRYSTKGQMRRGLPDLSRETSCLDDDFTAEELRIIADSMDELKERLQKEGKPLHENPASP